ncbi:MAG: C1 family peptidase [Pirellulales bacterium]
MSTNTKFGDRPSVEGGGYFIVRNAWGDGFANRGYVGMTFDYAKKYGIDAYIVTVTPPSPAARSKSKDKDSATIVCGRGS